MNTGEHSHNSTLMQGQNRKWPLAIPIRFHKVFRSVEVSWALHIFQEFPHFASISREGNSCRMRKSEWVTIGLCFPDCFPLAATLFAIPSLFRSKNAKGNPPPSPDKSMPHKRQ